MVSATFVSILRSGRGHFNQSFIEARRLYPDLEGEHFSDFLRNRVDAIVEAVATINADRAAEVAMVAYDAALSLVGQKLAGPNARLSKIDEGWNRILPKIPSLLISAPSRIIPALSNALHQLATTPDARPDEWIATMETLGPQCTDQEMFLRLGQFAGWLSGLAHFREGALDLSGDLPEKIVLTALGVSSQANWPRIRSRLQADRWFDPRTPAEVNNGPRVVARVGAFKGFGGLFPSPPLVAGTEQHLLVRSGNESWYLTADNFGATFHRATIDDFESAFAQTKASQTFSLDRASVSINGSQIDLPDLGYFTSSALNETTLALTSALTHSIILIALK